MAEPLSMPTGAALPPPPIAAPGPETRRRWPRRLGAAAIIAGFAVAGVFGWQWNEARHDAAAAANVLPSEPVDTSDLELVEFEVDRSVDVSVRADLASGEALAVVSGGLSIARTDDGFWTREPGVEDWTPATSSFLERNGLVIDLIKDASIVTVTDVFPAEVHPYLRVVDDRSVADPDIVPVGPSVLEIDGDGTVRQLTLRVDRNALSAVAPLLARRLSLAGDDPVDVEIWLDRAGVVRRLSAPTGVTIVGGGYLLVSAGTDGAGPFEDLDPDAFEIAPTDLADPDTDSPDLTAPDTDGPQSDEPILAANGDKAGTSVPSDD